MKNEFLLFLAHRAGNVLFHDVRDEELRKTAGIDDLLSGLFNVLHEIGERVADAVLVRDLLKVVPPEAFQEKGVLHRDLPFMRCETVTVDLLHLSGERSLGDMKDAMEVQPFLFGRALPHADILPALPVRKVRKCSAQLSLETLLGMDRAIVRQRDEIVESLQIRLAGHPDTPGDQVALFAA